MNLFFGHAYYASLVPAAFRCQCLSGSPSPQQLLQRTLRVSDVWHNSSIAHTCVPAAKAKVPSPEGGLHSTQPSLACADAADFEDPDTGNTLNTTAVCLFWQNQAAVVAATRITTIQTTLNNRLTVAATVGDTALATAVTAIQTATPEVAEVILADTGADPLKYPYLVSTSCLLCAVLSHLCCINAERHAHHS